MPYLTVRLKIREGQIREREKYNHIEMREDDSWKKGTVYVNVKFASMDHIDDIMSLVRQVHDCNLNQEQPAFEEANGSRSTLSSELHAGITKNLNHVYDVVEGIYTRIKRELPPRRNEATGQWEKTDADQCAGELLESVRKLQVVLGKDSHNNDDVE